MVILFILLLNCCVDFKSLMFFCLLCHSQKMATGFIEQLLSDKYTEYPDFVQPILVALYEMKLGLSLILASIMQKIILIRVQLDNTNTILVLLGLFNHLMFVQLGGYVASIICLEILAGICLFIYEVP